MCQFGVGETNIENTPTNVPIKMSCDFFKSSYDFIQSFILRLFLCSLLLFLISYVYNNSTTALLYCLCRLTYVLFIYSLKILLYFIYSMFILLLLQINILEKQHSPVIGEFL